MQVLRYILFPLTPLYYLATWLRNKFYDLGLLRQTSYDFPLISVGNLSTGGTGKTPMVELLVELLQTKYKIAILSRGYKRRTKGLVLAGQETLVSEIGDEPYQYKQKYPDVMVAVDEDRRNGIRALKKSSNPPEIIILDDAFQHRKVLPGLQLLLTTYQKPYTNDFVLPTGNLREPASGANRADIIIVTKCPENISHAERSEIKGRIEPNCRQSLYFSTIAYSDVAIGLEGEILLKEFIEKPFRLVTGIANSMPLVEFLKRMGLKFTHKEFADHHNFTMTEINKLKDEKLILTTEKDYTRLVNHISGGRLYYLPIKTTIFEREVFEKQINDYLDAYSIGAAEF